MAARAMKPGLRLTQRGSLSLTPEVRQSMALLRQSLPDLWDSLRREAAENPFLVVRWPRRGGPATGAHDDVAMLAQRTPGLVQTVRAQIGLMRLAPAVRDLAEALAGNLRDDGYLEVDPFPLAREAGLPVSVAEAALAALQSCEPVGVGARDLSEFLVLQLRDADVPDALARAMIARLPEIAQGDWRRMARAHGLDQSEVSRLSSLVRALRPSPIDRPPATEASLWPDLVLQRAPDGSAQIMLNRDVMPRIGLSPSLAGQAGDRFAPELRVRAEAMVRAIRFRGETLERIARHLVAAQPGFLLQGAEALVPLTRAEVAEAVGLHPSTVGRAVAGKAIEVEGRLLPLSDFFASALPQADGDTLAGPAVGRRIARMIAAEDPAAPLSDAAIARMLAEEGVDIARRTVAKYRDGLL